jgi:hypothetical protein
MDPSTTSLVIAHSRFLCAVMVGATFVEVGVVVSNVLSLVRVLQLYDFRFTSISSELHNYFVPGSAANERSSGTIDQRQRVS